MRFFDLDGTLLDLWPRYYRVFCSILEISDITLEQYKEKKQELDVDEKVAIAFGHSLPVGYFERKSELLERMEFLKYDQLWLSREKIQLFFEKHDSMILTRRRNRANLILQLDMLDIDAPVVVVEKQTKLQWIKENYPKEESMMIGDSIMDLETGNLPNVFPVMVGYGLGTKRQFDSLKISYLYLDSSKEMFQYLTNRNIETKK